MFPPAATAGRYFMCSLPGFSTSHVRSSRTTCVLYLGKRKDIAAVKFGTKFSSSPGPLTVKPALNPNMRDSEVNEGFARSCITWSRSFFWYNLTTIRETIFDGRRIMGDHVGMDPSVLRRTCSAIRTWGDLRPIQPGGVRSVQYKA